MVFIGSRSENKLMGSVLLSAAQTVIGAKHVIKLARVRFKNKKSILLLCVLSNDFVVYFSKKLISVSALHVAVR